MSGSWPGFVLVLFLDAGSRGFTTFIHCLVCGIQRRRLHVPGFYVNQCYAFIDDTVEHDDVLISTRRRAIR